MTGQLLQGKFEVLREIGHGGMGVVYRARQLSLDRIVALKMLSNSLTENEEFRERFRQEAMIIARLSHPNIVQVYDVYDVETNGGAICIVMEYLDGQPLRDLTREAGRLSLPRAIDVAAQVASGLGYAHRQGIIHRDIKPDNVMIVGDDHVKIMDFGIARLRDSSVHTQPGMTMGTPQFMSPEQAAGKPVDARSDLYSLTVMLYRMVTGQLPFTGDSPISVALKHLQEKPVPPSQLNPIVPPGLEAIILRGLAKRPEDRFQTADEFRNTLEEFRDTGKVASAEETGEETFISTPVPQAVIGSSEESEESAEVIPVTPTNTSSGAVVLTPAGASGPIAYATPTPSHRFNWPWVAAAVPGLLALALIMSYAFGLLDANRVSVADLKSVPVEELLRRLDKWETVNPKNARRFIERNESILYERVSRLLNREGPALPGRGAVRQRSGVISRNLSSNEARARWGRLMDRIGEPRRPRPDGRREGGQPRSNIMRNRLEETLERLHENVEPNPLLAQIRFEEARDIIGAMEAESDPRQRTVLFQEVFSRLVDSARFDRENATYSLELEKYMAAHAKDYLAALPSDRIERESSRLLVQAANSAVEGQEREEIRLRLRMHMQRERIDAMRERIDDILEQGATDLADLHSTGAEVSGLPDLPRDPRPERRPLLPLPGELGRGPASLDDRSTEGLRRDILPPGLEGEFQYLGERRFPPPAMRPDPEVAVELRERPDSPLLSAPSNPTP